MLIKYSNSMQIRIKVQKPTLKSWVFKIGISKEFQIELYN